MTDPKKELSSLALTIFALNGKLLTVAEQLAAPAGITATRWQVLGAVLDGPRTQADIARKMGITRQSVQRTSTKLIDDGLLESISNPSHRKAMLLKPTEKGFESIAKISPHHGAFALRLADEIGLESMAQLSELLGELNLALDNLIPNNKP
jgi:DNA-binding MarR family transcriptional regulator